jgi:tape measure domain-containing protein
MSKTVDSKVVEMSFDNKNFEKNVNQSLGTLDKLKKSLNFDETTKGLDKLQDSAKRFNFDAIGDAVEKVRVSFSAFDIFSNTLWGRVSNKILDCASSVKNLIMSMSSINQIAPGWDKYAEKTTAVQTIMSATTEKWKEDANAVARANYLVEEGWFSQADAKNVARAYEMVASGMMSVTDAAREFNVYTEDISFADSLGLGDIEYTEAQMEYVSELLDKLNWFSDETSYSFIDMTSNIGKFVSAGVPLSDAVEAMEGISVWAAKSGARVQEASRAYYNLSQALATGSVKLIDWKSIENANMSTMEFKQTAIDTAVALGTLEKAADGMYHVVGEKADKLVSAENFNEALTTGWFSKDVLMQTLQEYGKATTLLAEISEKHGVTATQISSVLRDYQDGTISLAEASTELQIPLNDLSGYFNTLTSEEYALSLASFRAAQEAKTFQEAIDATKDAVSTGWMKTFEYIFGTYEEAKVVWSELAERLYDVFALSGESRNRILELFHEWDGNDALIEAIWNIWDAIEALITPIKEALGLGEKTDKELMNTARRLTAATKKFRDFTATLIISDEAAEKIKKTVSGVVSIFRILGKLVGSIFGGIGKVFKMASGEGVNFGDKILNVTASLGDFLTGLEATIDKLGVFEYISKGVAGVVGTLAYFFSELGSIIHDTFVEAVDPLEFFLDLFAFGIPATFVRTFYKVMNAITGEDYSEKLEKIIMSISKFRISVKEHVYSFIDYVKTIPSQLESVFQQITGMNFEQAFEKISTAVGGAIESIKAFFASFKKEAKDEDGEETVNPILESFTKLFDGMGKVLQFFVGLLSKAWPLISGLFGFLGDVLGSLGTALTNSLESFDLDTAVGLLFGGGALAGGLGIGKFFTGLEKDMKPMKKVIKNLAEGVESFFSVFEGLENRINAGAIKQIAISIGIISASLFIIAGIDGDRLVLAGSVIAGLMTGLFEFVKYTNKLPLAAKSLKDTGKFMLMAAASILLLAFAMVKLAEIPADKLWIAMTAITALMVGMYAIVTAIGKMNTKIEKNVKKVELSASATAKYGATFIGLAVAILILAFAIAKLGSLPTEQLIQGMIATIILIGALTAAIILMAKFASDSETATTNFKQIAKCLILLAAAVLILSFAVAQLGALDLATLAKGMIATILLIAALTAAIFVLGTVTENTKPSVFFAIGLAFVLIAASMLILVNAVAMLGALDLASLAKGIIGLIIVLAAVTASLVVLGAMGPVVLAGAAAMLIAGFALQLIAATLLMMLLAFQQMDPDKLNKSLWSMVKAFGALALCGILAGVAAPGFLLLGAAIVLIGVGVMAAGTGVMLLATGLSILLVVGTAAIGVLTVAFLAFIELLPLLGIGLAKTFVAFIKALLEAKADIAKAFMEMAGVILDALTQLIPKIVGFVVKLFRALAVLVPEFVIMLIDIIVGILKGLAERSDMITEQLVKIALGVLTGVIDGLILGLAEMVGKIGRAVIDACYLLGDTLVEQAPELRKALHYLCESMWTAFLEFFGIVDGSDSTEARKQANVIGASIAKGIKDKINEIINKIVDIYNKIKGKFASWKTNFSAMGTGVVNNMKAGISGAISSIEQTIQDVVNAIVTFFNDLGDKFVEIGKNILGGLIKGMKDKDKRKEVKKVSGEVGKDAETGLEETEEISSPSKVWTRFGQFMDTGLINGLKKYSNKVNDAAGDVGESALNSMNAVLDRMSNTIDDNMDVNPVITPVLDLSEIQNGSKRVGSFFDNQNMNLAFASDGFNYNMQAAASEKSSIVNAINAAIGAYVPQIIDAINDSTTNVNVTADLTPNSKKFYDEMRVQNQIFKRSKGYSGL